MSYEKISQESKSSLYKKPGQFTINEFSEESKKNHPEWEKYYLEIKRSDIETNKSASGHDFELKFFDRINGENNNQMIERIIKENNLEVENMVSPKKLIID